ncbi:hypothetical protein E8D34_17280 [Nocardioides sp. GY 10113]|uniref:hypothetical protein n=1 Tax=Nocardioides sp. GY 10113 TaxID=2569761 RepID=UPI0010A81FE0|nr:hypothetical protein [Nocardioides sp. GY 10113]TIC82231.1 hypothetical protein E8D34_17280 [Nocardioides sp. GY 10113]
MPRPPLEIDDRTPLDGAQIDLPARIGWLLRSWRTHRGISLRELQTRLADLGTSTSVTALSRVEVSGERNSTLIEGYERGLGLPHGALRAPIDVLCRTYDYRPADVAPLIPSTSLETFSTICGAVDGPGARPTGRDWMRFAEAHTDGVFGLPRREMEPVVARLAQELGRSVGTGYQQRYDALARLRCGRYGDVVFDVVAAAIAVPGAQRLPDLMSAVCERPSTQVLDWCAGLLDDPCHLIARAACLGLQNLRFVGGLDAEEWADVAPRVAAAADLIDTDPSRGVTLSSMLAASHPALRAAVPPTVRASLPDPPRPPRWTRNRLNVHYSAAAALAAEVADSLPGETMLTRLVFEALYDFRAAHAVTSSYLIAASPFAPAFVAALGRMAAADLDPLTRSRLRDTFGNLMYPTDDLDSQPLLASEDPHLVDVGLRIDALAGRAPATPELRALLAERITEENALLAAGMAEHPLLAELAADPGADPRIREAAGWWRATGGRIVDPAA